MQDPNPSVIIRKNHELIKRYAALKESLKLTNFDENYEVILNVNEEEGIISYDFKCNDVRFLGTIEESFRMDLKESASTKVDNPLVTYIINYRFQGMHKVNEKWSREDYIAFDYEPNKKKYPKIHINAYKSKWGDHLSYPETTNLNLYKMSCPLAIQVFNIYGKDKDNFPADCQNNTHYVALFEEVDYYGQKN